MKQFDMTDINHVLWDMDGELIQTDHIWKNGFLEVSELYGHTWNDEDTKKL